jgi:hypothetical protein
VTQVLTGKVVLLIFLVIDTTYVARIVRREARALSRRMPRWHGPELVVPRSAAFAAGDDLRAVGKPFHEPLDRWFDQPEIRRATDVELVDMRHPGRRNAA